MKKLYATVTAIMLAFMCLLCGCDSGTIGKTTRQITVSYEVGQEALLAGVTPPTSSTLTLELENGSVLAALKLSEPTVSWEGHTLNGWSTSSEGGTLWDFRNQGFTENTTLYAVWDVKRIVTFDVGMAARAAGVANPDSQQVDKGATVSRPSVTWDGYSLLGWFTDVDLTQEFNFLTTIQEDTTLYASWTNAYIVNFVVGAAAENAGMSVSAQTVLRGEKAKGQTLSMPGYIFNGWCIDEQFNSQWDFTKPIMRNLTLYADWIVDESASAYEDTIDEWSEDGHFYLHYKRYDHDSEEETVVNEGAPDYTTAIESSVYADRGLWAWEQNPRKGDGRLFNASKIDASGAVYDILLDNTYTDGGWNAASGVHGTSNITFANTVTLGIQLFSISSRAEGGFWSNDGGDVNVSLEAAKREVGGKTYYHWFVMQGAVGTGSPTYSSATITDPFENVPDGAATSKSNINSLSNSYADKAFTASGYENTGVGYQIFIASFADSDGDGMGDIGGIINKLDYLDNTVNADVLWLTPFQSSTSYHGYDIKDYYSVDARFGTKAQYRELVYKAHQRGIKVVMDYVLNHTSLSNPWFIKSQNLVTETYTDADGNVRTIDYRNFYHWRNETQIAAMGTADGGDQTQWYEGGNGYYFYSSFSSSMPELNYDYQPVRDAIVDVAKYWMAFGLDGLRLDAVKHIYMRNEIGDASDTVGVVRDPQAPLYEYNRDRNIHFFREFNAKLKSVYPGAFLVGENLDGSPTNTTPFFQGLDSQFNFNMYYDLTAAVANGGNKDGNIITAYKNTLAGYEYARGDTLIDGLFTSNHDLQRAYDHMGGDDATKLWRSKVYASILMTLPGITWIYYGDELGMSGSMADHSIAHADLIYRQPMKWVSTAGSGGNCGYSIGEGLDCEWDAHNTALASVEEQIADGNTTSLLYWYSQLTAFRDANPVLINGQIGNTTLTDGKLYYQIIDRANSSHYYDVYVNLSGGDWAVGGSVKFGLNNDGNNIHSGGVVITEVGA